MKACRCARLTGPHALSELATAGGFRLDDPRSPALAAA